LDHRGDVAFVEEAIGALYPQPTELQREVNARCERLIADYLLLFSNRALFGPKFGMLPAIPAGASTTDVLLIYGPALPKFIGRVCYSHQHRSKTVAVLAPTGALRAEHPKSLVWSDEPEPPRWHDFARRRWTSKAPLRLGGSVAIGSFDIVSAVGDGITGRYLPGLPCSTHMWQEKSDVVRKILAANCDLVGLYPWVETKIWLPMGMAYAAREAVIAWKTSTIRTRPTVTSGVSAADLDGAIARRNDLPVRTHDLVRRVVATRSAEPESAQHRGRLAPRASSAYRLAARTSPADRLVSEAVDSLRDELGDFVLE
jgi:hypothetical protein